MKKIINYKTPYIGNGFFFVNVLQKSNQYVLLKISVATLYFYEQQIQGIVSDWLKCCCQWAVDEVSLVIGKWLSALKWTKIEIVSAVMTEFQDIYQQEPISKFLL